MAMEENEPAKANEKRLGWQIAKFGYFAKPHDIVAAFVYVATFLISLLLVWLASDGLFTLWLGAGTSKDGLEAAKNLILGVSAVLAAPFFVWRALVAHQLWRVSERQAEIQNQTMQSGLLTKAIEQLGAMREEKIAFRGAPEMGADGNQIDGKWDVRTETVPNIEVRLGAIYLLKRLAEDNNRDHGPILVTLCASVRENSRQEWRRLTEREAELRSSKADRPLTIPSQTLLDDSDLQILKAGNVDKFESIKKKLPPTREDIQSAIVVIGDKKLAEIRKTRKIKASLSLHDAILVGANFAELCWDGVNFFGANLTFANFNLTSCRGTVFRRSICDGADFYKAIIENCDFSKALLRGSYFLESKINSCIIQNCSFTGSIFIKLNLFEISLICCNFQNTSLSDSQISRCIILASDFRDSNFEQCFIQSSDLKSLDLTSARFNQTMLNESKLGNCFIDSADLSGISNLDFIDLDFCFGNNKTILPNGIDRPDNKPFWDNEAKNEIGYNSLLYNRYRTFDNLRKQHLFLIQQSDMEVPK